MGPSNNPPDSVTPSQLPAVTANDQASPDRWRVHRDGTYFWAVAMLSALRDGKGGLRRSFAQVTRELSSGRRAEESLRRIEALAQSILDALPAHVAVLDHSGQ